MSDDWQGRVLAKVRENQSRNRNGDSVFSKDLKPLQFSATRVYMAYVNRAAQRMGVNRSTFVRRALAVAAASVLQVDVRTILFESPPPRGWDAPPLPPHLQTKNARDVGVGIERWCPHPGCDGSHL